MLAVMVWIPLSDIEDGEMMDPTNVVLGACESGIMSDRDGHIVPPEISMKVDEILEGGAVLRYLSETVERAVVGNKLAIRLLILVCMQRALQNGHGIYIDVNGASGSGKSYLVRQVLWILPEEFIFDSSMSAKAIYYHNETEAKIFYIDDFHGLDDNVKSVLKNILTNFRRPTRHSTVSRLGNMNVGETKTVPARTVILFSAVDSIGDEQLMSRLIPLPVEYDEDAKKAIHEYQSAVATGELPDLDAVLDEQVKVAREVIRALTDKPITVVIPFAKEIEWPADELGKTRNYDVFLDLIKLCAIVEQRKRNLDGQGRLIATYDDFYTAANIYAPRRAMQATKLSEGPQKVLEFLMKHPGDYTQGELVEELKVNQGNLSRWLKILTEMSKVVEESGVREHESGTDSYGRTTTKSTSVKVYQYKGEPVRMGLFDTPLQLSELERNKPEYKAWKEAKV